DRPIRVSRHVAEVPTADTGLLHAARRPTRQHRDVETSCGGLPFSAALRCCPACVGNLPTRILGRLGPTAREPFLFGLRQEVDMMTPTSMRSSIPGSGAVFTSRRMSRCQFTDSTS